MSERIRCGCRRCTIRGLMGPAIIITVGVLLLLDQMRGSIFSFGDTYPVILIVIGMISMAASRAGDPGAAKITPGEVFLVLGLLSLLGMVVAVDTVRDKGPIFNGIGNNFEFGLEVAPKPVPVDARITIRNGHGDISIRPSDEAQIRISGKKYAKAWNEGEAQKFADRVSMEIVKNGDGYEIRRTEPGTGDSRISLDLDVQVPKKAALTFRNQKGDITVADMRLPVSLTN